MRVIDKKYLLCGAAALSIGPVAKATLLIDEPFNYTSGQPITGQINTTSAAPETWLQAGTAASSATNQHQIASGSLTAANQPYPSTGNMADLKLTDDGELERMNIPNAFNGTTPVYGASSTLYYSLLLNVPSTLGMGTAANHTNPNENNDIIVGLNNSQGSQAGRPSTWNGELVIRQGSTAGTYNLGIRASTTDASTTYFDSLAGVPIDFSTNVAHFIVVEAQLGATPTTTTQDSNAIWVDPNPSTYGLSEGSRPSPDGSSNGAVSTTNAALDTMESMLIGAGIAAGSNPNDVNIDEIELGTTWADVTSPAPEPTVIGLFSLAGLALARRRRRTC